MNRWSHVLVLCASLLLCFACGSGGAAGPSIGDQGGAAGDSHGELAEGACRSNSDCPVGKCSPVKGICVECTTDDDCPDETKCLSGKCLEGVSCVPGEAACDSSDNAVICNEVGTGYVEVEQCDDEISCTADTCDGAYGCEHKPDNGMCDDGNDCTLDICDLELGCTHEISPDCKEGGIADPQPVKLNFPPTVPQEQMTQETLALKNSGLGELSVFELTVEDDNGVFFLFFPPNTVEPGVLYDDPVKVLPSQAEYYSLVFIPEQLGVYEANLVIRTNDGTRPEGIVEVPLAGIADADNCVEASPSPLDFAQKETDVLHTMDVLLENCGDGLVPIYEISLNDGGGAFSLEAYLKPPFDLDSGQTTTLTIGFTPLESGKAYAGSLYVLNGAPKTPEIEVMLTGTGAAD
jgi:hypothetical protein